MRTFNQSPQHASHRAHIGVIVRVRNVNRWIVFIVWMDCFGRFVVWIHIVSVQTHRFPMTQMLVTSSLHAINLSMCQFPNI